jgi:hypothetical protein
MIDYMYLSEVLTVESGSTSGVRRC